ncbi:MAG: endoglucanase Acf2 [Akkermansiaceae bacterium]|jgi:endoglucanase Acf2
MKIPIIFPALFASLACLAFGESIQLGAGSYSTERPAGCEALPQSLSKTSHLKGATPTNQWWSSLVWENYSQNLFPHPLAMVCHEGGLAVTYPGAGIDGRSGNIMGGGVSKTGDFVLGHSGMKQFPSAKLAGYSEWFVTVEFREGDLSLQTSFGHGSPYVFGRIKGGDPLVSFSDKPIVWSGDKGDATIGVTVRGNHYGLFGSAGSTWTGLEGNQYCNVGSKGYFSVALLPDKEPETLATFAKKAHYHVVDTQISTAISDGNLETSYQFKTVALEGNGKGTVYALYPHQWKYSEVKLTGQAYRSVRGAMKVAEGSGFKTVVPIQGLLPMLPAEGIEDRARMVAYLKKEVPKEITEFKDTYWEGKHLGKLATLSGIAEMLGEKEMQKAFVGEIQARLENWLTASEGEVAPLFYYDKTWGTLIGSKPSYGSDGQLNDHHFHYGYFIRAAAEVARINPAWATKWGPMINLMIRDIASTKKDDPLFPHLRCFDIYAGHSWASGHAKFGDGNNQESSSESMNAWYGLMLWGEVTGDKVIRDTGIFLYNTERTAVEEYWFDVSGTNFPKDFPNVALGMIWGGKGAFATWFSGDIDCIHGINWLPFTPASIYMGRFPDYVKKNHDRIVEKREKRNDYNNGWGDLVVMFNALSDPKMAASYIDENPDCSLEGGNTHAFMYHWIHTLDRLGRNEASVTSEHPFVNVYRKGGKKTYAAYNFQRTPLKVRFSDGFEMTAKPAGLSVKSSAN